MYFQGSETKVIWKVFMMVNENSASTAFVTEQKTLEKQQLAVNTSEKGLPELLLKDYRRSQHICLSCLSE